MSPLPSPPPPPPLAALLAAPGDTPGTRAVPGFDSDPSSVYRAGPSATPDLVLERTAAVLGPMPPSAPLNIVRWAVDMAALDEFESGQGAEAGTDQRTHGHGHGHGHGRGRALIVTGPRAGYHAELEAEDEPHLRFPGTDPGMSTDPSTGSGPGTESLVDMRYCPSPAHARLLLTLLTGEPGAGAGAGAGAVSGAGTGAVAGAASTSNAGASASGPAAATARAEHTTAKVFTVPSPRVVVLYDILGLFAAQNTYADADADADATADADAEAEAGAGSERRDGVPAVTSTSASAAFAATPASLYLDIIAAARSAAAQLGSALVVLEPHAPDMLPIMPGMAVPVSARGRSVGLEQGLKWLLGCVLRVKREKTAGADDGEEVYAVSNTEGETAYMRRRECARAEFAVPPGEVGQAWMWEWVTKA